MNDQILSYLREIADMVNDGVSGPYILRRINEIEEIIREKKETC